MKKQKLKETCNKLETKLTTLFRIIKASKCVPVSNSFVCVLLWYYGLCSDMILTKNDVRLFWH